MNITSLIAAAALALAAGSAATTALRQTTAPAPLSYSEPSRLETKCLRAGGQPASCANFASKEI